VGEEGLDQGGLSKELFTLMIQEFIEVTVSSTLHRCSHQTIPSPPFALLYQLGVLCSCGEDGRLVWFNHAAAVDAAHIASSSGLSTQYMLGLVTGLAVYNSVLIGLPLPSSVYKIFTRESLVLADLWLADPTLAGTAATAAAVT
jgi:hypothetical protein